MLGSVPGFALVTAPVLTFLFTVRDGAIAINCIKNGNHAVVSFFSRSYYCMHAVQSSVTVVYHINS